MKPYELDTFDCQVLLDGWRLHLAQLAVARERELGNVMDVLVSGTQAELARRFPGGCLQSGSTLVAIRDHLRCLGIDPDATPPCSELMIRGFLADGAIARGALAWEFLAALTIRSQAPWAVLDRCALKPPLVFRQGTSGETLPRTAGEFDCNGLPVLADQTGVVASPWTYGLPGDLSGCPEVVFVCFLPQDIFRSIQPKSHLGRVVWLTWAYRFVFERTCSCRAPSS